MWRRVGLFPLIALLVAGVVVGVRPGGGSSPRSSALSPTRQGRALGLRSGGDLSTSDGSSLLAHLPVTFVQNRGEVDSRVGYYALGGSVFFTPGGVTLAQTGTSGRWAVKVDFLGAARVSPQGIDRAPGVISYFHGPRPAWRTGLPTFGGVRYRNVWPGIDLVYRGGIGSLEYSFLVHPGADPRQIRLGYRGITDSSVGPGGNLHLSTPVDSMLDRAPRTFQRIGGRRDLVRSAFRMVGSSAAPVAGFSLGSYDRARPLVIDPYLVYSGFIGGVNSDLAFGVDVDAQGNAYVAGFTNSPQKTFPETVGPDLTYNDTGTTSFDAFVAKVNGNGTKLLYCGYIGGANEDQAFGVAVDSSGAAYVTGTTLSSAATFPVTIGPDLVKGAGSETDARDGFIAKVDPTGTKLDYAGYIGGNDYESGKAVAVDSSGAAYVLGVTESDTKAGGFPATVGPDLTYNGNTDVYVGKVQKDGTGFDYLGYLGGTDLDSSGGIAVDGSGGAYAVGFTWSDASEAFPLVGGGDSTLAGFQDAYISKVDPTGASFVYSAYIGGVGAGLEDSASSVAVDGHGDAFVTGRTDADQSTFPVVAGPDHHLQRRAGRLGVGGEPLGERVRLFRVHRWRQ